MYAGMNHRIRDSIIDGFQDEIDENGQYVSEVRPDFLIGSTEVLGTGHTCTRAFRVVLMEPDYKVSTERQAIFRISRFSQFNRATWSYHLFCQGLSVETAIMKRQQARLELSDMTFAYIPEDVQDAPTMEGNSVESAMMIV